MPDTTITSANSVFTLTASGVFPAPVQLEGYSSERAWESEQVQLAEENMSVDGRLTFGYTPNPYPMTVSLQADSPSKQVFLDIARAMIQSQDVVVLGATISLPSTGETFNLTRGVLKNYKTIPDAAKVLQAMNFQIVWEKISPTLL